MKSVSDPNAPRIPVWVVTGFLGAGKTTLLRHLASAEPSRRIAVIENEFGETGVDGTLLAGAVERVVELTGGCICCTVRQDLIEALESILDGDDDPFDVIIIETTGLAEPAPVLRIFEQPQLSQRLTLSGVVTVIDGVHFERSLSETSTSLEQVVYADLVLLNKIDLMSETRRAEVRETLAQINPLAAVIETRAAQVRAEKIWELKRLEEAAHPRQVGQHQSGAAQGHSHDHHAETQHDHQRDHGHQHDQDVNSVALELLGDIDVGLLDQWLGELMRSTTSTLLRVKGVLAVPGYAERFVFQAVRDVVELEPGAAWRGDARRCRLVLIGRGLDRQQLQRRFRACSSRSLEEAPSR